MKKVVISIFLILILATQSSAQTDGRESLFMNIDHISINRDNDFAGELSSAYFEFFITIKISNPHSENITVIHNGCRFTAGIEVGENGTYIGETQYLAEQVLMFCTEIALSIQYPPGVSYQNTTQWLEVKNYNGETIPHGQYYVTVDSTEYDDTNDNYFGAYLDKSSMGFVIEYEQGIDMTDIYTNPIILPIKMTAFLTAMIMMPVLVKLKK